MESGHLRRAIELGGAGKAHLLTAFLDDGGDEREEGEGIEDPAGGERSWYEAAYDRLEREIERIVGHLDEGEGRTG